MPSFGGAHLDSGNRLIPIFGGIGLSGGNPYRAIRCLRYFRTPLPGGCEGLEIHSDLIAGKSESAASCTG